MEAIPSPPFSITEGGVTTMTAFKELMLPGSENTCTVNEDAYFL
jgi:hypothetical protein